MWDNSLTEFQKIIQIYYFLSPEPLSSFTISLSNLLLFPFISIVQRQSRVLLYKDYDCQLSTQ